MARIYNILRVVAYIAGLAGMVLFVTARQSAEPQTMRAAAGGILLIVSFICFLGTYAIYLAVRLRRNRN
jgi:cbb3-type cytochrome oxidase subunit 3